MSSDLVTALMQQSSFRSHRILKLQEQNNSLVKALQELAKPLEGIPIGDPWAFYEDMRKYAQDALEAAGVNHEQI